MKRNIPPKAEEFIASLVGRSQTTKKLYLIVLSHFFEFVKKEIKDLEILDLQKFLHHLEEEHRYKKNSLRAYINILRSFLQYLKRDDLREQITTIKPSKTLPLVPKREEIEKMIETASTLRDKMIIRVFTRTGLRVGELCNLDVQDIDLQNLRLIVRSRGQWEPKGAKERVVRMDSETASLIQKYISSQKEGRLVHITPSTIRNMITKVARKAAVRNAEKISPHKLRHFFACDFLQRGGDARSLQKLLGHAELSTTEIYLDYSFDMVSHAYNKVFGDKERRKREKQA